MQVIETTAPISIEELKKYFANKETFFVIDYAASELKGQKLLTYISNLDLPVDVVNYDSEFVKEYFHSSALVNLNTMEMEAIEILFEYSKLIATENYTDFINDNKEILEVWKKKLDSLTLYNMYTVDVPEFKDYATSFPTNNLESLEGVNFISLLKHEVFFEWYKNIDESTLEFYNKYFNEYMFKGRNLYSYWANENNPMFLLTWGIASNIVNADEYVLAKEESIKESRDLEIHDS